MKKKKKKKKKIQPTCFLLKINKKLKKIKKSKPRRTGGNQIRVGS